MMDFCPALDMANMCIQLQATLDESGDWSGKDFWTVGAAWAQAIFSVGAIGAAIFISNKEHSRAITHQATERRQARIDWLNKVAQIIEYCANEFEIAATLHRTDDPGGAGVNSYSWSFEYLREILEGIDAIELPDQISIAFMLDLRKNLVRADEICKKSSFIQRHTEDGKRISSLRAERLAQFERSAIFVLKNLRAHIKAISGDR